MKIEIQTIDSYDVNEYLKQITNEDITAKDFRTWGGTVLAAVGFNKKGIVEEEEKIKQNVIDTIKEVAQFLRNRPATCRKYYIHPSVIDSYTKGFILSNIDTIPKKKKRYFSIEGLDNRENNVLALLTYSL